MRGNYRSRNQISQIKTKETVMDTEQFKLILELISGTTGDAKDVAIVWLIIQGIGPLVTVVGYSLSAWVAIQITNSIRFLISQNNIDTSAMREIVQAVQTEDEKNTSRRHGYIQAISHRTAVSRVVEAFTKKEP